MSTLRKFLTEEEKAYIARFIDFDGHFIIADALEKKPETIRRAFYDMRRNGLIEQYRKLWNESDANHERR